MPTDVTDAFDPDDLPIVPIRTFASQDEIMAAAEDTTYLSRLTEAEAKQLVTRSVTMTRFTDMILDLIAQDSRFGYESKAEVMRHAIELLIGYYTENKAILAEHQGFASDTLRRQHELRLDAERARVRTEFRDNITAHDDELDRSRDIHDWSHIAHRLTRYREMLRTCESETQRQGLRDILAGSNSTRSSVIAFYNWTHDENRVYTAWDDDWPALAEMWAAFYSEMA